MTTPTERPISRDALAEISQVDDARFWELAALYGFRRRPAAIDLDQAWFRTRRWVTMELEADLDCAEGRTTFYASDEEFLAALEQLDCDSDPRG